jgi:16S rRNA (cytosine1402-N4)-methyltransferase
VTAASEHEAVLVAELLETIQLRPGEFVVDGTVGYGGHAAAMLQATAPDGRLLGINLDAKTLAGAASRLAQFGSRVELRRGNFADLLARVAPGSADAVVLDLGINSAQLADPSYGFSHTVEGRLDMRLDKDQSLTAEEVVNQASEEELARIFRELGNEPAARRLARAIGRERAQRPIRTTRQLANLIEQVSPRRGRLLHPATKALLALRCYVNSEPDNLKRGMAAAWTALKQGGRMATISFHSGEHRVVKDFADRLAKDYETPLADDGIPELRRSRPPQLRWIARKGLRPSTAEMQANPRSRSAQLRAWQKL